MAFNHEKLKVYQRALPFNRKVGLWVGQWDSRHAVCDQLSRAAGSMLENIAVASASCSAMKRRCLDYAVGTTLECAACLDLARIKQLLDAKLVASEKEDLSEILRMLVGLRRAWSRSPQVLKEGRVEYGEASATGPDDAVCDKAHDKACGEDVLFHHETLDVYRVAIEVATAFCSSESVCRLADTQFRRLDELLTSMVLNIAEGNGRFSDADQQRFLGTSHEAAIKMAARLDLYVIQDLLPHSEVEGWKPLLERVSAMTFSMAGVYQR